MGGNLFDKVWDLHAVRELPTGQTQLFIGLHLIHEVTSPQGFQMLGALRRRTITEGSWLCGACLPGHSSPSTPCLFLTHSF